MRKRLLNLCLTALMSVVSTAAWALSDVNGVYQISSAEDFNEFAALVNGGAVTANAVLTADIDLGMEVTMVGINDNNGAYHGTFDGQGHTIKINMYPEENYAGLFRYVGWRGVIENLKVEGTITTSSKLAAGIAGRNRGTIRNCWANVTINSGVAGDGTHGGIAGTATNGCIIENCLVQTTILGESTKMCGGVIGWADSKVNIVNCLVLNDGSNIDTSDGNSYNLARNPGNVLGVVNLETYNSDNYANRAAPMCYNNYVTTNWKDNNGATVVPFEDLADGRICYQLNNDQSRIAWVQTIGTDPFPVPAAFGQGQVYASGATDCDGKSEEELIFSNTPSNAIATPHSFDEYGICTQCGLYNFHFFDPDDPTRFDAVSRSVLLGSKDDFVAAEGLSRVVNGFKLHMKMTADVEYICEPGRFIFNTSDWIEGDFNGDGHELTIGMTDMGNNAALFPQRHYGSVENLIMHGSIETSGMYWGSISNDSYERLVRNVYSDINFTSTHVGDNTAGGFFGMIRTGKDIENCIYAGDINLPGEGSSCARVGGFAGWTHARTNFKNCAVLGNINGAGDQCDQSDTENSGNIARNYGNVASENCYVLNPITGKDITDQDKYTVFESGEAGVASGELAFFLNGKVGGVERFYQRIGTDVEPLPVPREGGLVYASAASYTCDGTPVGAIYQNTPAGDPVLDPHDFDDMGICNNCGALDENFMTPVDGWYEISTPEQFLWWSNYASKHLDASAKLMEDIDLDAYNEMDETTGRYITPRFAQVGSEYAPFYGNFDGQRHTISNLNINLLGKRGCGLISVMNSQPDDKLSDRGLTADQARAEEGVYVKDVILDESCSITGGGYTGIVGMGSPWAGHITITGCMNLGDVYVVAGTNGSGMYGCSMGSACRVTINACGVIGDIHVQNDTRTENGSFSGWLGSYAEVTNCFGLGKVEYPDPSRSFARHPAGAYDNGTVIVKNCYALSGAGIKQVDNNSTEDVAFVTKDELLTGSVTWKANGYQFRDPVWYQTLEEDEYPYPFDTHAVVIYAAEQYFSAETNKDIEGIASEVKSYEEDALSEVVATQSLIDKLNEVLEAMSNVETFIDFADALDSVSVAKAAVAENAKVYEAYIAECERISAYLAEHDDFAGEARTALESYLAETDEPSEDNPLGTYAYIIENHTATAEEITAETERVTTWLATAIAGGYIPGTDVSSLIPNGDFSKKNEGWTNGFGNGWDALESGFVGVEGWNVQGDMYQTVEGMKPGYYLVGTHAAFRPSNDRYSTNYAAGIYANGVFNYFPAAIEGAISVDEAIDGVNSNITIKAACDLPIYEDGFTTEGEGMSGYVVQGPYGMAIAGSADRYEAYTIAFVGEDGKLTIGIKNPGTKYGNDWTGWTSLNVTYCGDDAEKSSEALDKVLENMVARANTLIQYHEALLEGFEVKAPASPNFPTELKTGLETAIAQVEGAETVEAKAALAAKFSELFEAIYEGKQAYVTLNDAYTLLECLIRNTDLPLVEKDVETGDWYETGDMLLFNGGETQDQLEDISYDIVDSYIGGSYSTEEALDAAKLNIPAISEILPAKDEDGYYLISNPKQFVVYRAIASNVDAYAKAKLTADIDMAGIAMKPFGGEDNTPGKFYRGKLDGQNHALTNLYISGDYIRDDDPATLFYEIKGTTIKNLKITGEYYTKAKFMGGLTRWASEGNTVDNVEIAVVMHSLIDGDGTHGGVFGVCNDNTVLSNCIVNCTMIGEGAEPTYQCAGVCGWGNSNFTVKNTLILSQYVNITKGVNGNVIGRNGYTATNVYYAERSNPGFDTGGTLASDEQLASGEITWNLNGSTSENPTWFQTLGVDETPRLFDGATVYYYAGKYINEKPNPQLNAFAYNLDAKLAGQNVVVSFNLNAEAEGVEVNFYNGEEKVYTAVSNEVYTAGAHKVTVPASELGSDPTALNFDVAVTGKGSLEVTKMDSYKVWGPYGMAINNNPASKGFGQVLLAESWIEDEYNNNGFVDYLSADKVGALYAFDADFQPINAADGTPGFYGGLDIAGETPLEITNGYKLDLMDLRFSEDGRLFVARSGAASNSSVWEINPEDLNEAWKPVFTGGELDEATGITYVGDEEQNRMAVSIALEGKGDDLKMYVLGGQRSNGEVNATDFNCALYNLGTATEWTAAPTGYVGALDGVYVGTPYQAGIYADGQGGLWFLQRVNASTETPSIKHFDAEGNEDYSNTSSQYGGGRMTVTADGNYLAIPTGSGTIVLYETNYVPMENGKIFLNPKQTIKVGESSIASMAFDYANNLYVASGGTETFSRYTIPGMNKVVVTPGNGIVEGGLEGDLNNDGKVDIADAVTVLNVMAGDEQDLKYDVNGDGKVDIADFVTILNLMAAM